MKKMRFLKISQDSGEIWTAIVTMIVFFVLGGIFVAVNEGFWWSLPLCLSVAAGCFTLLLLFMICASHIMGRHH